MDKLPPFIPNSEIYDYHKIYKNISEDFRNYIESSVDKLRNEKDAKELYFYVEEICNAYANFNNFLSEYLERKSYCINPFFKVAIDTKN